MDNRKIVSIWGLFSYFIYPFLGLGVNHSIFLSGIHNILENYAFLVNHWVGFKSIPFSLICYFYIFFFNWPVFSKYEWNYFIFCVGPNIQKRNIWKTINNLCLLGCLFVCLYACPIITQESLTDLLNKAARLNPRNVLSLVLKF